jgi:endo-1,3(4)-beta-glucanase
MDKWNAGPVPARRAGYVEIDDPREQAQAGGFKGSSGGRLWAIFLATSVGALLLLVSQRGPAVASLRSVEPPAPDAGLPFATVSHPMPPSPLWGVVSRPYPTGAWWTNLVVGEGDGAVGALPYGVQCVPAGIQVSYGASRRLALSLSVTDIFAVDLRLAAAEPYLSRAVAAHDNLSVTMGYQLGGGGGSYSTPLVKGSPFITVVYTNSTPSISSDMHILRVEVLDRPRGAGPGELDGSLQLVTLGNYLQWLVYCSDPVHQLRTKETPAGDIASLTTGTPISGVVRVALVPLGNTEASVATLVDSLRTYPVGAQIEMVYHESVTKLEFSFATVSVPKHSNDTLLMLALPHHLQLFSKSSPLSPKLLNRSAYGPAYSMKGVLRPVLGKAWTLHYDLVSAGWTYDAEGVSYPTTVLNAIAGAMQAELNASLPQAAPDPYGFGKEAARMASLGLIAEYLGIAASSQAAVGTLRSLLQPWLTGANADPLVYDSTWGGLVTSDGLKDAQADFGNAWYNDHHFQYGYLIFAGAVLAHLSPGGLRRAEAAFVGSLVRRCVQDRIG